MPVTKTAKRALRVSKRKREINTKTLSDLEIALRVARKDQSDSNIQNVFSLADRAAKKNVIHKNKAARIKSAFSKTKKPSKAQSSKKSTKTKKKSSKKK